MADVHDVMIIGGGPAGLHRGNLRRAGEPAPLVAEGFGAGGQLMLTSDVENYPGFADGHPGPRADAGDARPGRALRRRSWSRRTSPASTSPQRPFRVWVDDEEHQARSR